MNHTGKGKGERGPAERTTSGAEKERRYQGRWQESKARKRGEASRKALEYAANEDLVAIKFTAGHVGIANEIYAALVYYGAAPKMAEELDRDVKVWLDATEAWESSRFFVERKVAAAMGMMKDHRMELESGRWVTYWQQQLCGVRGRRVGWIPGIKWKADGSLKEVQADELTREVVSFGVTKGIWQHARWAECELRFEKVRTAQRAGMDVMAVVCGRAEEVMKTKEAVEGWLQSTGRGKLVAEGDILQQVEEEEKRKEKAREARAKWTDEAKDEAAARLLFMVWLPAGLAEEELRGAVMEVMEEEVVAAAEAELEAEEEEDLDERQRKIEEIGEEMVQQVRVWSSQSGSTQAEVLFKDKTWADKVMLRGVELERMFPGAVIRRHRTRAERGLETGRGKGAEADVRWNASAEEKKWEGKYEEDVGQKIGTEVQRLLEDPRFENKMGEMFSRLWNSEEQGMRAEVGKLVKVAVAGGTKEWWKREKAGVMKGLQTELGKQMKEDMERILDAEAVRRDAETVEAVAKGVKQGVEQGVKECLDQAAEAAAAVRAELSGQEEEDIEELREEVRMMRESMENMEALLKNALEARCSRDSKLGAREYEDLGARDSRLGAREFEDLGAREDGWEQCEVAGAEEVVKEDGEGGGIRDGASVEQGMRWKERERAAEVKEQGGKRNPMVGSGSLPHIEKTEVEEEGKDKEEGVKSGAGLDQQERRLEEVNTVRKPMRERPRRKDVQNVRRLAQLEDRREVEEAVAVLVATEQEEGQEGGREGGQKERAEEQEGNEEMEIEAGQGAVREQEEEEAWFDPLETVVSETPQGSPAHKKARQLREIAAEVVKGGGNREAEDEMEEKVVAGHEARGLAREIPTGMGELELGSSANGQKEMGGEMVRSGLVLRTPPGFSLEEKVARDRDRTDRTPRKEDETEQRELDSGIDGEGGGSKGRRQRIRNDSRRGVRRGGDDDGGGGGGKAGDERQMGRGERGSGMREDAMPPPVGAYHTGERDGRQAEDKNEGLVASTPPEEDEGEMVKKAVQVWMAAAEAMHPGISPGLYQVIREMVMADEDMMEMGKKAVKEKKGKVEEAAMVDKLRRGRKKKLAEADKKAGQRCAKCLLRKVEVQFIPCGHAVVCGECAKTMGTKEGIRCTQCKGMATGVVGLVTSGAREKEEMAGCKAS